MEITDEILKSLKIGDFHWSLTNFDEMYVTVRAYPTPTEP